MKWPEIKMAATAAPARTGGESRTPSIPRLLLEEESRRLGAHRIAALTTWWFPRLVWYVARAWLPAMLSRVEYVALSPRRFASFRARRRESRSSLVSRFRS